MEYPGFRRGLNILVSAFRTRSGSACTSRWGAPFLRRTGTPTGRYEPLLESCGGEVGVRTEVTCRRVRHSSFGTSCGVEMGFRTSKEHAVGSFRECKSGRAGGLPVPAVGKRSQGEQSIPRRK